MSQIDQIPQLILRLVWLSNLPGLPIDLSSGSVVHVLAAFEVIAIVLTCERAD